MKYKGLIIWIKKKNEKSIYNPSDDGFNTLVCNTPVTCELTASNIKIAFNWDDLGYTVDFNHSIHNIYEGTIINQNQAAGGAILQVYSYENTLLCKMDWKEDFDPFECFIQLEQL